MIGKILKEGGASIWKELRDDALKKVVSTSITEGIKAVADVWKKRRIREDQFEFDRWKSQQDPLTDPDENKQKPTGEEEDSQEDSSSEDAEDEDLHQPSRSRQFDSQRS